MYAQTITNYEEYLDEIVFSNNVFSFQSLQRRLKKLHRKDNHKYNEFAGLTTEVGNYINDDVVNWRGKDDVSGIVSDLVKKWADYIDDLDKLNKIRTTMLEDYDAILSSNWEDFEEKIETDMTWGKLHTSLEVAAEKAEEEIKLREEKIRQELNDADKKLYEDAKKIDSVESYRHYLKKCSECLYKTEAKQKIQEFEEKQQLEKEEKLFNDAVAKNTVNSYQKYLKNCKICKHEPEAKQKLKELEKKGSIQADKDLFNKAKAMDTIEAYEEYMVYCDLCSYRTQAENRIAYLRNDPPSHDVESKKCPECGKGYTSNYTICLKDGAKLINT